MDRYYQKQILSHTPTNSDAETESAERKRIETSGLGSAERTRSRARVRVDIRCRGCYISSITISLNESLAKRRGVFHRNRRLCR